MTNEKYTMFKKTARVSGLVTVLAGAALLLTSCADMDAGRQKLEKKVERYEQKLEKKDITKARDDFEAKVYKYEDNIEKKLKKSFYDN